MTWQRDSYDTDLVSTAGAHRPRCIATAIMAIAVIGAMAVTARPGHAAGDDDPFTIVGPSRRLSRTEVDHYRVQDESKRRDILADAVEGEVAAGRLNSDERSRAIEARSADWRVWEFGAGTPAHQTVAAPVGIVLHVREGRNAVGQPTWDVRVAIKGSKRATLDRSKHRATDSAHALAAKENWIPLDPPSYAGSWSQQLGCGFFDTVCFRGNYFYQLSVLLHFARSGCSGCNCSYRDYSAMQIGAIVASKWGGLKRAWTQLHVTDGASSTTREKVYPLQVVVSPNGTCITGSLSFGINYSAVSMSVGQGYQVCNHEEVGPTPVAPQYPKDGAFQWLSDNGLHDNESRNYQGALIVSMPDGYGWPGFDLSTYTGFSR
jgi:hypothetical protein